MSIMTREQEVLLCTQFVSHDGPLNIYYNPHRILKWINKQPGEWKKRMENITKVLDKKVTIDKENTEYSNIVQGMVGIVDKLCVKLPRIDCKVYAGIRCILTGSQFSDCKVGLPHEADFLLTSNEMNETNTGDFEIMKRKLNEDVYAIMKQSDVRDNFKAFKVHTHRRIPGICIVMEYKEDGKPPVGVTMDYVFAQTSPKQTLKPTDTSGIYFEDNNFERHLKIDLLVILLLKS